MSTFITPLTPALKAEAPVIITKVETPATVAVPASAVPVLLKESVLVLAEPTPMVRPRAFYVASQWNILPAEGEDRITATNNTTADKYEGSIADFNDMLRGL